MNRIEKIDGYVYLVEIKDHNEKFKTYYNLGKDPNDPRWFENEEKPKQKKTKAKKDE